MQMLFAVPKSIKMDHTLLLIDANIPKSIKI